MCLSDATGVGKWAAPLNKEVDPVGNATNRGLGMEYDGKPKTPEKDPNTPATGSLQITPKKPSLNTVPTGGQPSASGLAIPQ